MAVGTSKISRVIAKETRTRRECPGRAGKQSRCKRASRLAGNNRSVPMQSRSGGSEYEKGRNLGGEERREEQAGEPGIRQAHELGEASREASRGIGCNHAFIFGPDTSRTGSFVAGGA